MKTQFLDNQNIVGIKPSEAYSETRNLISELQLYKDEYLIFEELIDKVQIWDFENNNNGDRTELVDAIYKSEKRNFMLLDMINKYSNRLKNVLETKTLPFSENEHRAITSTMKHHRKNYQRLKKQVLNTLKWLKKEEKTRRLLSRKENLIFNF